MIRLLTTLLLFVPALLAADPPLNFISYNIRNDNNGDKGPRDWDGRKGMLADYLLDKEAGFIGLQEVKHNQLVDMTKALPEFAYVGVGRDDGKTKGEYSPLFYRKADWKLDPTEHGTFWLSDTPDVPNSKSWGNEITRICTWARFIRREGPAKGKAIYIFNTHWDHRSQPSRVKSGELMLKRVKSRTHPKDPVIFMGDLNATTENPAVAPLLDSGILIDHDNEQMRSSSGWRPALYPGLRIDHIFTSSSILSAKSEVQSAPGVEGHAASDHHPVFLSIPSLP